MVCARVAVCSPKHTDVRRGWEKLTSYQSQLAVCRVSLAINNAFITKIFLLAKRFFCKRWQKPATSQWHGRKFFLSRTFCCVDKKSSPLQLNQHRAHWQTMCERERRSLSSVGFERFSLLLSRLLFPASQHHRIVITHDSWFSFSSTIKWLMWVMSWWKPMSFFSRRASIVLSRYTNTLSNRRNFHRAIKYIVFLMLADRFCALCS